MICRYKAPRPYFHTFEGDDAQIGLNFADEGEAEIFQQTIEAKLTERRNRRERRQAHRRQQSGHSSSNGASKHGAINGVSDNGKGIVAPLQTVQINRRDQVGQPVKKGDKKKLKKEDIGMPTNFQHISHVGWDPNHGFDLENVDPNLKKFFHKAGVDEKALQDKDTRDFIYDFIDKHGGVEAALREVNSNSNSMELSTAPPPPPRSLGTPQPVVTKPPPPNRIQSSVPPPPPVAASSRNAPPHRAPPHRLLLRNKRKVETFQSHLHHHLLPQVHLRHRQLHFSVKCLQLSILHRRHLRYHPLVVRMKI